MGHTTSSVETEQLGCTLAAILECRDAIWRMIQPLYYVTSEHVPNSQAFYKIPETHTEAGFIVVCHPSMKHRLADVFPEYWLLPYGE